MSTSNIKTPTVVRRGFIENWNEIDKNLFLTKSIINCEFNQLNLLQVSCERTSSSISIVYYKWLQLAFLPYNQRFFKQRLKQKLELKKSFQQKYKVTRLSNKYKRNVWQKRASNYINRIKTNYLKSQQYYLPTAVFYYLQSELQQTNINRIIITKNVYSIAAERSLSWINCVDFSLATFQLRAWSNFKFYLDAMVICNFISLNLMQSSALIELIKNAFIRNSKRGQQLSFLKYVQKLPALLQNYTNQQKLVAQKKSYFWIISVHGKFSVTGRTQKFIIQPKKLPLHTLSILYDYAESFVNTKAGSFSIRVWRYKL